jgi:hypothetical protein
MVLPFAPVCAWRSFVVGCCVCTFLHYTLRHVCHYVDHFVSTTFSPFLTLFYQISPYLITLHCSLDAVLAIDAIGAKIAYGMMEWCRSGGWSDDIVTVKKGWLLGDDVICQQLDYTGNYKSRGDK